MTFKLPNDLSYDAIMSNDLVIPNESATFLDVANVDDRELDQMLLGELERAPGRTVVRDAGGCKGRIKELMPKLFGYYARGCHYNHAGQDYTFQGLRFSGGTETAAVTNVPAYLARIYPCIAGSTTPRTARMALKGADAGGGISVDAYGSGLDQGQHSAMVVQQDVKNVLSWSGDVRSYVRFMATAVKYGFAGGVTVCNGGDVSLDEALLAWLHNIPVILIRGTERGADVLVESFEAGSLEEQFAASFENEDRLLSDELDNRAAVAGIDFESLTRIAEFDETLEDLGASTFAQAHFELNLLTPVQAS